MSANIDKRSAGAKTIEMPPGPYVAKVISHLDGRRSGALQVQLLKTATAGGAEKELGELHTVRYCMPFYGVTDVASNRNDNFYSSSQQSYGFWAVPPDPGTKVLVIFAEGKINQGYWIGCIQDEFMNFMVPGGYPTAKSEYVIQETLTDEYKNKPLPTGEYNKVLSDRKGTNPDKFLKPHNPLMATILSAQGLLTDPVRGLTSSSGRRDIPSTVFGWNTPGPLDKRDGAPKGKYGPKSSQVDYFRSRLGGSAFVMDDGDPTILRSGLPQDTGSNYFDVETSPDKFKESDPRLLFNEHVKLRTRTGHQILLHNSEDLIYIGNARGSAWIELTSNGKIDIYTDDSISVRSANDINMHSDRDINFSASRNVNINAGLDMKTTVVRNSDTRIGVDSKVDIAVNYDEFIGVNKRVFIGADQDHQIKGTDRTTIDGDYNLQVGIDGHIAINANFHSKVFGDYRQTVNGAFNLNTTGDNKLTSGATTQIKSTTNNKLDAGVDTEILSGTNHLETAGNHIHMNSTIPATASDSADSIGDTFVNPVSNAAVDESDQVLDKDGTAIDGLRVTADAQKALVAEYALFPRRVPRREPWAEHENLNPSAHFPSLTEAIQAPPEAVRNIPVLINSEKDQPQVTDTSGPVIANSPAGKDNPQVVVPGQTGPSGGNQPAHPVEVDSMKRYFLSELMSALGLKIKDPDGTPINAHAIAMAMAQVEAECGFKPRTESMNYTASRLRAVFPSRVKSAQFANDLVAAGQAAIGNTLYGGRYGNAQDEGYKYRGRGLIQITFKANYEKYGGLAGVDIVNNPEMANDPEVATKVAVAYLKSKSIPWDSTSFSQLGEAFRKAVGYANQGGAETFKRIGIGKGFYAKLINDELTPLASLTTVEYPGTGETTVQ